jgi:hypothetical protein
MAFNLRLETGGGNGGNDACRPAERRVYRDSWRVNVKRGLVYGGVLGAFSSELHL